MKILDKIQHEMMRRRRVRRMRRKRNTERRRQRERRDGKRKKQRERQRGRERHQTLVVLRKRLPRSQSVACAEVQAGRFQSACRFQHPTCSTVRLFDPCFKTGRDQKKTRACELVHHRRCSKWPPPAHTYAKASVNEPSGARLFSGFWVES